MAELSQVGKYKLTRLVGEGGMGAVYESHDPVLSRRLAIKVLHRHLCSQRGFTERFMDEAKIISALKHASIPQVFALDKTEDGRPYMVMEYVDGDGLDECLPRGLYREPRAALMVMKQLCEALDFAHHNGVVHRDIKPSNVKVKPNGEVVLIDFGIARMKGDPRLTQVGQVMITPQYASPEQCRGEEGDHRSDVYSLAIVLYEMLSGIRPFDGDNQLSVMEKQREAPPPPLIRRAPSLPKHIAQAIHKALEKDPGRRQQSAMQFYRELTAAGAQGSRTPKPRTRPAGARRVAPAYLYGLAGAVVVTLASVVALGLVAGGGGGGGGGGATPPPPRIPPPTLTKIAITSETSTDLGRLIITEPSVELELVHNSPEPDEMRLAGTREELEREAFTSFSPVTEFTFGGTDGTKQIWAQVKNRGGTSDPRKLTVYLDRGYALSKKAENEYYSRKDYRGAEKVLKQALARNPKSWDALMTMSATLMMERQTRQARVYWKKAADLESEQAFTPEMKKIIDQYDRALRQAGG